MRSTQDLERALRDDRRRPLRQHPRLPRGEDRPPPAARHPLDEAQVRHLRHRRLLDRLLPLAKRRAPDRARARHRPRRPDGWRKISRLAKKAEPRQNQPQLPWRWVGYNGDANHGRGDHLHLSYAHSDTRFNRPAKTIYTRLCPATGPRMVKAGKAKAPEAELAPVVAEKAGLGRNPANDPRLVDDPLEGYRYDRGENCKGGVPKGMRSAREVARSATSAARPGGSSAASAGAAAAAASTARAARSTGTSTPASPRSGARRWT